MQELRVVDHEVVASVAMAELMRGDKEEKDDKEGIEEAKGKGSSSTKNLGPKWELEPQATMLVAYKFWAKGPSIRVARQGPHTSLRAQEMHPLCRWHQHPRQRTKS